VSDRIHIYSALADGAGAAHLSCPPGRLAAALVDPSVQVINGGRTLASGSAYFTDDTEPYISGRVDFTGGSASATHSIAVRI